MMQALSGEVTPLRPIWLMRQAGRYLPEYRELRATEPSFMDFCFHPAKAAEATLQPIRRFGFDAAIIFSDILTIPLALGQDVTFGVGEGPRLPPLETPTHIAKLSDKADFARLAPVYEALDRVKSELGPDTTLIGFCGAPWTVATYMVAGRGTPDQGPARMFAYQHPDAFQQLIDLLVEASIEHLSLQIRAGADVVQIFESWAGVLPELEFDRWCLAPLAKIAAAVKTRHPRVKIIGFPRTPCARHVLKAAALPDIDGVSIDTAADAVSMMAQMPAGKAMQGNLDPLALLTGGDALERVLDHLLSMDRRVPHIFNLGHGILPTTPIPHVERLVQRIRAPR